MAEPRGLWANRALATSPWKCMAPRPSPQKCTAPLQARGVRSSRAGGDAFRSEQRRPARDCPRPLNLRGTALVSFDDRSSAVTRKW